MQADLNELQSKLIHFGVHADAKREFPRPSLALLQNCDAVAIASKTHDCKTSQKLKGWLSFVGRADLSVGRLFEGHINAIQLIGWYGSDAQQQTLQDNLAAGKFYGVWATEPPPGVLLNRIDNRFVLNGCKSFASGAGQIDFAIVTAKGEHADRCIAVVPANDPMRTNLDGWQVRGMRATLSGTYDLTGLYVTPDDIIGQPGQYDAEPRFTAGAWRFLAVQLGGIEALVIETRAMMSDAARADPLQRLKFANAVEAMRTAQFWVEASARMFARDDADAPSFVRMARGVVERAAMDVMEYAARIVGTRSAFDGQRIDKITRDLGLYLRQAGTDHARDQAALAWLDHDISSGDARLW